MKQIFVNGKVYTGSLPLSTAFAEEGGVFIYAGDDAGALALAGPEDPVTDLGGAFVCPGFNDSHMHLLGYGRLLSSMPLAEHTASLADMLATMQTWAAEHPSAEWIYGRGWNQDYFTDEARMPEASDLDKVSTDRPVCAVRACGHCLAVNHKALQMLGIDASTPVPRGGKIELKDGQPNGLFFDGAMELIYSGIPAPGIEELKDYILTACRGLNAYGITSSQTDDYCVFRNLDWQKINEAYRQLEEEGRLTVRVNQQTNLDTPEKLQDYLDKGLHTGVGTHMYKMGPLKLLQDGSLGARTAYLSRPYADDQTQTGFPIHTQQELDELIGLAHQNGMPAAAHVIGDRAMDMVLDAYEKAFRALPRQDHRSGLVHCQISRPDQFERIRDLGLHIYAQSIFLDYDTRIVEKRAGKELASTSYSWKTLKDMGVTVSNGSDGPVEMPNVLAGIQCAVTRQSLSGGPVYLSDQAFSMQEALDSFTKAGAFASFEEEFKGRIAPGMAADFTVLSEDLFQTEPCRIKDVQVLQTWLGGKRVY